MSFRNIFLFIIFFQVNAFALDSCEQFWSQITDETSAQVDKFTFFSMGPYEMYPNTLGRITEVAEIGFESGKFILGTDAGYVISKKAASTDFKTDNGRLRRSAVADHESFTTALVANPFVTAHSIVTSIAVQPVQKLNSFAIASQNTAKVIASNGKILDIPYSAKAQSVSWNSNGILVTFSDRIRLYDPETLAIKKEIQALDHFSAVAPNPSNPDEIVASDGMDLVVIRNFQDRALIKTLKEPAQQIQWNNFGIGYYVIHSSGLGIFDRNHNLQFTETLDSPIYSISWDLSGDNLAFSTFHSTWIFNLSSKTAKRLFKTDAPMGSRITWFDRDNILATINAVAIGKEKKWEINFWNAENGLELSAQILVPTENQISPPQIIGIRGSILNGSSHFYILTDNGYLFEMFESFKSQIANPTSIN